jgi:hypothetical protein
MSIGDSVSAVIKNKLFKSNLEKGSVFINKFDSIDHPKFFIVVGLCTNKILTCSVYINSEIHPAIKKKKSLFDLQVPLAGSKYDFLTHDSYACCSTALPI